MSYVTRNGWTETYVNIDVEHPRYNIKSDARTLMYAYHLEVYVGTYTAVQYASACKIILHDTEACTQTITASKV